MSMYEAQVEAVATSAEGVEEILLEGIIHADGTVEEGRLSSAERQDDSEESETRKAKKLEKQRKAFREAIREERFIHQAGYVREYHDKKGGRRQLEIEDCNPLLYLLEDQPNAPQLTAQATETRSGPARLSDEA